MFSLSTVIRVYIIFTIVVMMSFFIAFTSVDVIFEQVWVNDLTEQSKIIFRRIYVTVIVMSLIGIVGGSIISIFTYTRGLNKYQDLLRRFDSLTIGAYQRPSSLSFPEKDEFGNLGEKLNTFIQNLDYYDQMKSSLANLEKEKFIALANRVNFGVLLIDTESAEPYIHYYNDFFKETFLKKSVFIDSQGIPQTQYYSLENTPLAYFTIKNKEKDYFFDEKHMERIKNNVILLEKTQTFNNVPFVELSGDKTYMVEELLFIPLNNTLEKTKHQVLYLFVNPKPIESTASIAAQVEEHNEMGVGDGSVL